MSMLEDDLLDGVVSVVQAVPNLEHRPEAALGKEAEIEQNIYNKNWSIFTDRISGLNILEMLSRF